MSYRPQTLPLTLAGGLDTKQDEKTVALDKMLQLQNVIFDKGGTAAKRNGYESLGRKLIEGGSMPDSVAIASRDDELVSFSEGELYSRIESLAAWTKVGDIKSVGVTDEVIGKRTTEQTHGDCATVGGVTCYMWEDGEGGVWYQLTVAATDAVIKPPTQLNSLGQHPRVFAAGVNLVMVYARSGSLWSKIIVPSTPLVDFPVVQIVNDLSAADTYDLHSDGTKAALVYATNLGSTVKLAYIHQSGVIGGPLTSLPSPVSWATTISRGPAVSIDIQGTGNVGVIWGSAAAAARFRILDNLSVEVVAITDLDAAAEEPERMAIGWESADDATGDRMAWGFWDLLGSQETFDRTRRNSFTTGSVVGTVATTRGVSLASRAFSDASVYVNIVRSSTFFSVVLTMRSDELIVARFLSGISTGRLARRHLAGVSSVAQVFSFVAGFVERLDGADDNVFGDASLRRVDIDFDPLDPYETAELGRSLYVGGGLLHEYDGARVAEAEFHWPADDIAAPTQAAPVGVGVDVGTHLYALVTETVTERGELKRGAVSPFATVVVSGSPQAVTFELPTHGLSRWSGLRLGLYRSLAGEAGALYRVTSVDPTATGINGYVLNDKTVDTIPFTDEVPDVDLEKLNPLYTNGGILSNDPVPPPRLVTSGKTRLFVSSGDSPDIVRFSQELDEEVTVEMSAVANRIRMPALGGDLVAIAEMDGAVIVFKETAIYAFGGSGPLANPDAGGGFSIPTLITSDVGCSSASSVAITPNGLVFQARKGIHLLNRSRQVQYIGADVEAFTDPARGNQTIVSATLSEDRRQIRFLSSSGQSLLWDYSYNKWSSWKNHVGLDSHQLGNLHHYVRTDGTVWRETPGVHVDGAQNIPQLFGSPWIRFAGTITSEQQVNRLTLVGNHRSVHKLRVRFYYDYEAGHEDESTIDPSEFIAQPLYGEGQYGQDQYGDGDVVVQRYEVQFHVAERCRAFRFTAEDLDAVTDAEGAPGAAFELTGAVVEGGIIKRGAVVAETRMG